MARAVSDPFTITILPGTGGTTTVEPGAVPAASNPTFPIDPGMNWWGLVIANLSAFYLRVNNSADGAKWVPPFTADRFQGCETCKVVITAVDPNPPGGTVTHTGVLLLSWAIEPSNFNDEAYPHAL